MFFVFFFRVKSFAAKNHGQERCSIRSNICCFWLNNQSLYIIVCKSAKKKQQNWWSVMFMRVVASLNIAKSQGFSIILNYSTILEIMYWNVLHIHSVMYYTPPPLHPNQGGENGAFWLLHGFILDLGEGWGDSVQDCSLLRCGRYEFVMVVSVRNRRRLSNK